MSIGLKATLLRWLRGDGESADERALADINREFISLSAQRRIEQAAELLPAEHVLTSSFGAQAAVMLHLTNTVIPKIPVILIDTGYLFPETYQFIDELTGRLNLNLKVFRSDASPAWQESRFGKLWDQGLTGIEKYNRLNKQEPLDQRHERTRRRDLVRGPAAGPGATRAHIAPIERKRGRYKVHPLFDWTDRDVGDVSGKAPAALPPACGRRAIPPSAIGTRRARWPRWTASRMCASSA
jgi:phosphoadenosine phosphosulfate reductase